MAANSDTNVVIKVDNKLKEKLIKFYSDDFMDKTPPYATFRAQVDDCVVTLYDSGKCMFQGNRAKEESAIWEHFTGSAPSDAPKRKSESTNQSQIMNTGAGIDLACLQSQNIIGSDEVGTGDFFGPIVVTAAYVSREQYELLAACGVRDSKKLNDDKIKKIAPDLINKITHETRILSNPQYNQMRADGYNMNQIKAILHNECLYALKERLLNQADAVVVDQFEPPSAYYKHIAHVKNQVTDITFMTKAEDQVPAVACGSIISRYLFLQEMAKLGQEYGSPDGLPFGAGSGVDSYAALLMEEYGEDVLERIAKMNFANVEKARKIYDETR